MLENCFYVAIGLMTIAVILVVMAAIIISIMWCAMKLIKLIRKQVHKIMCRHGYHRVKYYVWVNNEQRYYCVHCHETFYWMKNVETDKYAYFNDKTGECCHHIKEV